MFGFEAREFLKRRTKLLAEKWEKPYSFVRAVVRSFTNARMSIALLLEECIDELEVPGPL